MIRLRTVTRLGLMWVVWSVMSGTALAQNTGIAGVVRDTSGAVLPGVTVDAASPALIEKVRTVVTNGQGAYSVVGLQPGVYAVTFTLPGFSVVRREGVELTGSFTATVNVEMRVGALEETITVTGESPIVDTRNVVQQRVVDAEVRDALPTGRHTIAITELIPGITTTGSGHPTGHDVAGIAAARGGAMIHGSRVNDFAMQLDGAPSTLGGATTSAAWQADPLEVQEFVFETSGISAEHAAGGVRVNIIPREGGNRYTGSLYGAFSNDELQANNISQRLIDLGLSTPNPFTKHWDVNVASGGPVKRDRLWYYASVRNWGKDEQVAGMFRMIDPRAFVFDPSRGAEGNADLSKPAFNVERNSAYGGRMTWQATEKNKFGLYVANQPRGLGPQGGNSSNCACAAAITGTISYEGGYIQPNKRNSMFMGTWKAPVTSKVLIEALVSDSLYHTRREPGPENQYMWDEGIVQVTDVGTGYSFRSKVGASDNQFWFHDAAKASVSYVTGSHSTKFGAQYEWGGSRTEDVRRPGGMTYSLRNGVPISVTIFNEPHQQEVLFRKVALFAQDQWTFGRFAVNGGLRFDQHIGSVPDTQFSGPSVFAPFQKWPAVENTPNWKDISPRFGVAYDLFGDGKTAFKYTVNRYVVNEGTTFVANENPLRFNLSANRPWNDLNRDFIPQENELGSLSNTAFGTAATTRSVDDAIREGWGVRQNNWEMSAGVQRQLISNVAVNLAYTRRWYSNFFVTDNRAVTPADFSEYCITAPTDNRLGDVSGSRICGLYDITPAARVRRPDVLQTSADNYGTASETWEGIDLTVTARVLRRVTVQGGLNSGTQGNNRNTCFVVDSPEEMRFCDINVPWRNSVKFLGSIDLPWDVNLGATFQQLPQPEVLADFTVTNAMIASGVVQFVDRTRTSFSGGSARVGLIQPGTRFLPDLYQVDLRLTKGFRFRGARGRLAVDMANLLNGNAIQRQNNTYGSSWQRPTYILEGRVIKPGFTLEF